MKNAELKLQYQLSNGAWVDCKDNRIDEFLGRCEQNNDIDREGVISSLINGNELRNDRNDWYSNCRCGNAHERKMSDRRAAQPAIEMVKCSCGHIVPRASVMSASLGSSCPDCYDDMSG